MKKNQVMKQTQATIDSAYSKSLGDIFDTCICNYMHIIYACITPHTFTCFNTNKNININIHIKLYQHRPQIAQANLCVINVEKGAPNVNSAKVGS